MDHVVVWLVFSFAVSPGTWPGGAWVPGGPRPCFLLLLLVHDPNFVFRNFHQDVSRFTVHKGLRPNSRIMYRFFTSHQPMMNEQDQVTWTNWPASKKKSSQLVYRATQDDPRPALAENKKVQCTALTPWQLSTLTHLLTTKQHT